MEKAGGLCEYVLGKKCSKTLPALSDLPLGNKSRATARAVTGTNTWPRVTSLTCGRCQCSSHSPKSGSKYRMDFFLFSGAQRRAGDSPYRCTTSKGIFHNVGPLYIKFTKPVQMIKMEINVSICDHHWLEAIRDFGCWFRSGSHGSAK